MRNFNIDFNKAFKKVVIVYAVIFLAGLIFAFIPSFGVNLDINFKGGTKIAYSYSGDVADSDIEATVRGVIDNSFTLAKSTALAGSTKTFEISLVGKNSISAEKQEELTKALEEKFADNEISLYNSNSVSPTIAGTFFAKSLVAVLITALLVVIYVGIRFRRIGGVSAALTALCALVFDLLITFCICVFFKLQIDSNYIAVVLTILGYSLNDTIVIYDRVREERKNLGYKVDIADVFNYSCTKVMRRSIVTSVTTFTAVLVVYIVATIYGLTSVQSFALPMMIGIASGCYSSLCIAGPLWVTWQKHKANKLSK